MRQEKQSTAKMIKRFRNFRYGLVLEGVAVGTAAGLVSVLFRLMLEQAEGLRQTVSRFCADNLWGYFLWGVFMLGLAALTTLLLRWEPLIGGSGIPQVEGELQGAIRQTWWRVLIAKFSGGVLTIGAGLSVGREGPSIQLGAMAGKGLSPLAHRDNTEEKMLMTCGASAGLAAAFNAPLAGVLFSLEELHKNFSVEVLLSTMASSVTADFISRNVFGLKPVFDFSGVGQIPLKDYWMLLLLGILLGALGAFYNFCVRMSQELYQKIPWQYIRVAVPFLLAGILLPLYPQILGGGHHLIEQVSQGMGIWALVALFGAKFLYSTLSFGSGAPGGIFLPLLVLGAVAGGSLSELFAMLGLQTQLQNYLILGMAGFFSAIVRSPVTGIILISEMTGSFTHLLSLSLVSLVAYAAADLLHAKPVYDLLLERMLRGKGERTSGGAVQTEKILIETPVCYGAAVCGKRIIDIAWPKNALIISVKRGETELIPNGETRLMEGDTVVVLCAQADGRAVYRRMEEQCKQVCKSTAQ